MFPSYSVYGYQGWQGASGFSAENPEDPGHGSPQYWGMAERWWTIQDLLAGTINLRSKAERYLPRLNNESDACYQTRINRSVLTPLLDRVIKAAVGLILRKPIILEGGDEEYWAQWRENVDRQNSDLDEFMGKVLHSAIAYGHCGFLCDFPSNDAVTLRQERELNAQPYFIIEQAANILGWRHSATEADGKIQQVRLREFTTEPEGRFGNKVCRQVRVVEPGKYEVWKEDDYGSNSYQLTESGSISLEEVPLSVVYSQREAVLVSKPPLEELAHLNIQHYQLQASLLNSLHVAAFPLLVLRGWDDANNELAQLSVGNAIAMPPEGGVEYVEPASAAFDALQAELSDLEDQIGTLGITMLARPKNMAESGTAKALDRADTNSMLAQISINLQQSLQQGINYAAKYAGVEPPEVQIDRDFNAGELEGQQIAQLISLFNSNILDKETTLKLLRRGEILDDNVDIEEILSATEAEELDDVEKEVDRISKLSEVGEGNQPGEGEDE